MKLWQKVFWCTFLLFELLYNASSFYLIRHNFNRNLVREVDRGLADQQLIAAQIETDWSYIANLNQLLHGAEEDPGDFLNRNAPKYLKSFDPGSVSIEIKDDRGRTVFTDFPGAIAGPRPELAIGHPADRNYIIRSIGPKSVLFVSGALDLGGRGFKLTYLLDLTSLYADKHAQIRNFIRLNLVIAVVLAAGLYGLIWFLTRSVRLLGESARTIASGRYAHRVAVLSKDEIGLLAEQFNTMAAAVEENVRALETAAENKQRFIHYLTHELKTPLTSIIGYADLLRATTFNEDVFYRSLNYIYGEGKRLESLAFKLMDLILVENRLPGLNVGEIRPLFEETAQLMKPQLDKARVNLSLSAEAASLPMERDLLHILCTNLIDNAVKASQAGSGIGLRGYRSEGGRYVIEVRDEGIGIPKPDIPNVFEPFYTADRARSWTSRGAGLGLAICSEIVRLHEGELSIRSRPGEGTVVRVSLPGAYN
ncbi:HAMP domain-containing histidine kinase [Paenibacillus sp. MWE-103]|uniref:histidine kinase n=1 Tax=Paenibacillus artemisiicola TaxID=1172618 RepID=A0ABS3WAM3_9BACL|nr:HAMP domain-containing sensor histidine kinase [Paenibacillus artemisiicola]MBO7745369.1 HAMP domain-containing histidine kinase [Paenibacillus artemisiicola]